MQLTGLVVNNEDFEILQKRHAEMTNLLWRCSTRKVDVNGGLEQLFIHSEIDICFEDNVLMLNVLSDGVREETNFMITNLIPGVFIINS